MKFKTQAMVLTLLVTTLGLPAGQSDARRRRHRRAKVKPPVSLTVWEKAGKVLTPKRGLKRTAMRGIDAAADGFASAIRQVAFVMTKPLLTHAPVRGEFSSTSGFGMRRHPILRKRKIHYGMDFVGNRRRARVVAAGDGVVVQARRRGGYGRVIIIDHGNGVTTRYAHLRRFRVRTGQKVEAGQLVGIMGQSGRATGVHLHFEVRVGDSAVNPERYVGFAMGPDGNTDEFSESYAQLVAKAIKKTGRI